MQIRFGHLYAADMNPAIRSKPGKVRPVVVIQSTAVIEAGSPGVVVPTTSKLFDENPLRVRLPEGAAGNGVASDVLVDQVHTLDRTLFRKELGAVPADRMRRIEDGLALLLRPDDT